MYEIGNELVHQKDHILGLVNDGRYQEATALLDFVAELWEAAGYGYKLRELRQRIRDNIRHNLIHAEHFQTAAKWQRMLDALPS